MSAIASWVRSEPGGWYGCPVMRGTSTRSAWAETDRSAAGRGGRRARSRGWRPPRTVSVPDLVDDGAGVGAWQPAAWDGEHPDVVLVGVEKSRRQSSELELNVGHLATAKRRFLGNVWTEAADAVTRS